MRLYLFLILLTPLCVSATPLGCHTHAKGVQVQALGSGGPELSDQRASSSYLIWHEGQAKLLVDMGSGSMLQLEQTQAKANDIEAILLTHLHVDHSVDLPAFIKAAYFSNRDRNLNIVGPAGNQQMPSTTAFVELLFGAKGVYRYLSSYLDGTDHFQIKAKNIALNTLEPSFALQAETFKVFAVSVNHGPIPAIAWQVNIGGKKLVFSGDTSHATARLNQLAQDADLLIAHHAVPESAKGIARSLHMPPSVIGKLANTAKVKQLVLSHHMQRTLHQFDSSTALIKQHYLGRMHFANDLDCFQP